MPSSWLGLVLFFLFIAPGLLFDLLADKRRAFVKESAFREVGRTILASVLFGLAGLVAVVVAHGMWPGVFADPLRLIGSGADEYVSSSAQQVAASLALQTLVAFAAVIVTHLVLRSRTRTRLRPSSTWTAVFREHTPGGLVPFARIRTKSGMVWAGVVYEYSPDLEVSDRELILGPPLASSRTNQKLTTVPAVWQRVVLRHDEIEWISVKYIPNPGQVSAVPAGGITEPLNEST